MGNTISSQVDSENISFNKLIISNDVSNYNMLDCRLFEEVSSTAHHISSWDGLIDKLKNCHNPISVVIIQGMKLDNKLLLFFQAVNPICFTHEIVFQDTDFCCTDTFLQLFREAIKPIIIHFNGAQHVSQEMCLVKDLVVHSSAKLVTIDLGTISIPTNLVVGYLHSKQGHLFKNVQIKVSKKDTNLEPLLHILVQKFLGDTSLASYHLTLDCSTDFAEMPAESSYINFVTLEKLEIKTFHDKAAGNFTVQVSRLEDKDTAHDPSPCFLAAQSLYASNLFTRRISPVYAATPIFSSPIQRNPFCFASRKRRIFVENFETRQRAEIFAEPLTRISAIIEEVHKKLGDPVPVDTEYLLLKGKIMKDVCFARYAVEEDMTLHLFTAFRLRSLKAKMVQAELVDNDTYQFNIYEKESLSEISMTLDTEAVNEGEEELKIAWEKINLAQDLKEMQQITSELELDMKVFEAKVECVEEAQVVVWKDTVKEEVLLFQNA